MKDKIKGQKDKSKKIVKDECVECSDDGDCEAIKCDVLLDKTRG
jgi:hypothetical protein